MAEAPATPGKVGKPQATVGGPNAGQKAKQAVKTPPPFQVRPLQKRERYLKLLIYGNFGTGKTHLAGTASEIPAMQDVFLMNAEAGDMTLDIFSGIDEVTVKTMKEVARVFEFLRKHCAAREAGDMDQLAKMQEFYTGQPVEGEPKQYKTVIVDSLSEIEQYCMAQLLGQEQMTKLDEDPNAAEWKEYKQNNHMIARMVRQFRNLPMHVIFTCAESFIQDETKKQKFSPALSGKLSKQVQGFFDMVGYLATANPKEEGDGIISESAIARRLYVTPSKTGKFDAKHRYSKFKGSYFQDPTNKSILEACGLLDSEGALTR